MKPDSPQVAIAILQRGDYFLLQLRDDIPQIVYPGYWAMFGGHLEAAETPERALIREIAEEIGYTVPWSVRFRSYPCERVVRHVFIVPLTVGLADLHLQEGWDMALWLPAEIRHGKKYSQAAGGIRYLAPPHQQILLDFLDNRTI